MYIRGISLAVVLSMCSCGSMVSGGASDTNGEKIRPVKSVVATTSKYVERDFAGLSTPLKAVNLAFKISGQLLDIPVVKGQDVVEGELLAQLDPIDIRLQLSADRSTFEQARLQYERAQRLLQHEALSQQEVESLRSVYERAKSAYENSEALLSQTSLKSPFKAVVERVYVDTYQRVQSGETVMRIVSPTTTSVEFTLPESSLSAIKDTLTNFSVRFDLLPSVSFIAKVIEYARTSSDASGFPVTLQIQNPDDYYISSGMSCTITMRSPQQERGAVVLPLSAIYSPTSGGTYVWVVSSDDRVERRRVVVARPMGERFVIVESGVENGERVVTAGVYQLQDNQRVTILK